MNLQTIVLLVALAPAAVPEMDQANSVRNGELRLDPTQLVRQLGARSFSVRRHATAELLDLGLAAMDALERGAESEDREIRFRCRHVLEIVREEDFQQRLRAFAAGVEEPEHYDLPSWSRFAKQVGSGPESRALFVQMQRAEPELLATLDNAPSQVGELLSQRVAELQSTRVLGGKRKYPSLGTVTSVLFVLNSVDVKLPRMTTQSIGSYFRYPSFATAIQDGPRRQLLRKMLGTWIETSEGWDAHHAMYLAMQYNMPVGVRPARRILQGEMQQPNNHFLGYALFAVARFGDKSDYSLVESFLDDEAPYGGTVAVAGKKKIRTQMRDIALATLIQLAGLDHKDFGFTRYRIHPDYVFNPSSLAFESDQKREAAIQKWYQYRRKTNEIGEETTNANKHTSTAHSSQLIPPVQQ